MSDEIVPQTPVENELANPYQAVIDDMKVHQDDASFLAGFVDTGVIVKALKKIKYNVKRKIELLGDVLDDDKSTVSETMRAMNALDALMEKALTTQGIFVRPHPGNGNVNPIGLPVASVTMTEKSITLTREATSDLEETAEVEQPLQEPDDGTEKEDNPEQDAFFEDNRGDNANIFRPASGQLGSE